MFRRIVVLISIKLNYIALGCRLVLYCFRVSKSFYKLSLLLSLQPSFRPHSKSSQKYYRMEGQTRALFMQEAVVISERAWGEKLRTSSRVYKNTFQGVI